MNHIDIIIVAHNEFDYVKFSIQSIRMFADIDSFSVILVDNNSDDALSDWATTQTDITYIRINDEIMPYGKLINQVRDVLSLNNHLLLLDSHYLFTPHFLSNMEMALCEDSNTGAIGPLSNGLCNHQAIRSISNYEEAASHSSLSTGLITKQVIGLSHEAILIHKNTLLQLGPFDESFTNSTYVIRDYCFRMIHNDRILKVCESALLWDSRNSQYQLYKNESEDIYLENKWGMHYFNSTYNQFLLPMIQHSTADIIDVLEIGCDCGATLLEIKNRYPLANIYGCELNEKAAQIASHFASVTVNNIEEQTLPYAPGMFDYIIFGDVLEHLHDPAKTIQYCKNLLKPNGHIIASIPNLMHISVISDLLKGNFTYTKVGLLDKTHIHFFTFNEIVKLFHNNGYNIEKIEPLVFEITPEQEQLITQLTALNDTEPFMYETFQYIVCAKVK